jgi:hypothetical protein
VRRFKSQNLPLLRLRSYICPIACKEEGRKRCKYGERGAHSTTTLQLDEVAWSFIDIMPKPKRIKSGRLASDAETLPAKGVKSYELCIAKILRSFEVFESVQMSSSLPC